MRHGAFLLSASLLLAACASTGIVPMDAGTYSISQKSAQVGFGPPVGARADVYREANTFCAQQSKSVKTERLDMVDSGFARPGSVTLVFRCE